MKIVCINGSLRRNGDTARALALFQAELTARRRRLHGVQRCHDAAPRETVFHPAPSQPALRRCGTGHRACPGPDIRRLSASSPKSNETFTNP